MDALLLHATSLLPGVSGVVVSALFSAIWEGTVLAVVVLFCLRLMPGISAAARSVIWMNVFALLVLLHVLPAISGRWASATPVHGSPIHLDARWSIAIAAVWALLSLWRGAQLVLGAIRLHQLASRATPIALNGDLASSIQTLLAGQNGRDHRSAELCLSTEVVRPSVFGFFRPRILIPPGLIQKLSSVELQQVVLHEMEHLHRGDDWSNLAQKIGLVLFPLNPALLWVERRLCAERELACDDRVLHSSTGRKAYAICLTRLAEYSMVHRGFSLVLGAWERQSELVRRVHRILRRPAKSISGRPAMIASTSVIVGALGCAIALAHSPQLISFAPSYGQAALQAHSIPSLAVRMNVRNTEGTPQLVKAVMPLRPLQSKAIQTVYRSRHTKAGGFRRNASLYKIAQESSAQARSARDWMVLTEWDDNQMPPHLVIAVDQDTQRRTQPEPRYAAIPFANGWLIVQI